MITYNIAMFALASIIVVQFVVIIDLAKLYKQSRDKITDLQNADKKRKMDDAIKRLCGEDFK